MKSTAVRRVDCLDRDAAALTAVAACTAPPGGSGDDEGGKAAGGDARRTRSRPCAPSRSRPTGRLRQVESTTTMGTTMSMEADGALGWSDGLTGTLTITYTGGTWPTRCAGWAPPPWRPAICRTPTTRRWATSSPSSPAASTGSVRLRRPGGPRRRFGRVHEGPDAEHHAEPVGEAPAGLRGREEGRRGEGARRDTTHYSGTVDVAELSSENSASTRTNSPTRSS